MAGTDLLNASHASPKVLVSQQMADVTEDTVYTAPAGGAATLKHGTVCNSSGGAANVSLSILKSGQATGGGQHRVISQYALAAGDTLPLGDYIGDAQLGPGDFVTVQASVANAIDVVISGVEYT